MSEKRIANDREKALHELLVKYHIDSSTPFRLEQKSEKTKEGLLLLPGWNFIGSAMEDNDVPLLTWRCDRRFVELKNIVQNAIIENVRMLRFSCLANSNDWSLGSLLYREMDLCEFICNANIASLNAEITKNQVANIILRLDNNILCSIEVSTQLPSGSSLIDRHEIISQRGIASDLCVDTQIPASSVYAFTDTGEYRFKDVDMELFGLDDMQIEQVRAAFMMLKEQNLIETWQSQHKRLMNLIERAMESSKKCQRIICN